MKSVEQQIAEILKQGNSDCDIDGLDCIGKKKCEDCYATSIGAIERNGIPLKRVVELWEQGKPIELELCREILEFAEHGDYSNGNVEFGTDEGMVRAGECLDNFRLRLASSESQR